MKQIIRALYPNGNVVEDWSSVKEAADYTGFNQDNILKAIRSGRKYKGFYWETEEVRETKKAKTPKKYIAFYEPPLFSICLPGEEWKDVKEFDSYMISNKGRILIKNYRGTKHKRILKPYGVGPERNYQQIELTDNNGNRSKQLIHRLVAEAFIPNPQGKKEIDHIDTNPDNNNVENLRWVTHEENMNNPITKERILNHLEKLNGKN